MPFSSLLSLADTGKNLPWIFEMAQSAKIYPFLMQKLREKSCKWREAPKLFHYFAKKIWEKTGKISMNYMNFDSSSLFFPNWISSLFFQVGFTSPTGGGALLAKIFTLDQAPKSNLVCIEYPVWTGKYN